MISNQVIKADVIADLKADTTITALLNSSDDIKESQYQGADFSFPAVRLAIQSNQAILESFPCDHALLLFGIRCYSEDPSSRAVEILANTVNVAYHRLTFAGTGWYARLYSAGLIPAMRVSDKLWRSEVLLQGNIYPTSAS